LLPAFDLGFESFDLFQRRSISHRDRHLL
jgi:hypothetical protein